MGTKNNPGKFDCYAKALPDEPIFHILARDPAAAKVIRFWISIRLQRIQQGDAPTTDYAMIDEAENLARQCEGWRAANLDAWKQ